MTIIAAATRGRTSFFAGSPPSARMASTCSVTFIAPTSAAMPLPMRPPTMMAVSVGPSSRRNDRTMTRGMYSSAAEALQAEGELDGHDHPDEDRRHRDDAERAHAERLDLVDGRGDLERALGRASAAAASVSEAMSPMCSMKRTKRPRPVLDEASARAAAAAGCEPRRARRREGLGRGATSLMGRSWRRRSADADGRRRAWRPRRSARSRRRRRRSCVGRRDVDEVVDAAVLLHDVDVVLHGRRRRAWRASGCAAPRARRRGGSPGRRSRARWCP